MEESPSAGAPTKELAREQWGTRLGFILAAVGSAVGLGNMWRFPYLTAEEGGAAFLVLYLLMVLLVGLPIMLAEFAVGRGAKKSPVEALAHYGGAGWKPLGVLFAATGFIILAYYGVIAGWTLRYGIGAALSGFGGDFAERFAQVSGGPDAVGWHLLFMAVTVGIVLGGIRGGIERTALVLMPVLALIVLGLAVYASTLAGSGGGYAFYLQTDFGEVLSADVLADAAGQAFFSLSLGMGAMLTFASYLGKDDDLPRESVTIALSDFAIAFLAGLMVFPVIFALGLSGEVGESTIGALFISLPSAFAEMGAPGRLVGALFFGALVVGALTSAISLLEVVVSTTMDSLGWTRRRATLLMGAGITLVGIPAALSTDVLGVMDQLAGNVFLVVGSLALAVFVGWVMDDPVGEVRKGAEHVRWFGVWRNFLRYVVPPLLILVLVYTLRDTVELLRGLAGG